jgi:hypothetical protein
MYVDSYWRSDVHIHTQDSYRQIKNVKNHVGLTMLAMARLLSSTRFPPSKRYRHFLATLLTPVLLLPHIQKSKD